MVGENMRDKRGFTLIELLAVITIMGALMMIAVPAVNLVIQNSRKNTYINDAKLFVNDATKEVINETWKIDDLDTTYYIHINNIVEDGLPSPSPWAEWSDAYVVVTFNEDGTFDYYWVSADKAGWKVDLKAEDKLIRSDVYYSDNKTINYRQPVDNRSKIVLIDANGVVRELEPYMEMTREQASSCYSFKDTSDTTITLTYYNKDCGLDVIIPAMIDGKKVTEIHNYTFNGMGLISVVIPDSIKKIGSRAFAYNKLTQVYIPNSVTEIGSEAFLSNNLSNLTLEDGLKTMGQGCFKKNNLTVALVPSTVTSLGACSYCENPIPNPSFLYAGSGTNLDYSTIRGYIGDLSEFSNKVFVIPSVMNGVQLKAIASSAFSSMNLTDWTVVIPDTVIEIGGSAFSASGIGSVNLPSGLKTIGGSAFYNNRIKNLNIPSSVTSIGTLAFNRNLVSDANQAWIYKRTVSGIDYSTIIGYAGANRTNLVIPEMKNGVQLKTLAASAFRYCNFKGTIKIPDSVNNIGSMAFALNELSDVDNGSLDNEYAPFVYLRKSSGGFDKTVILSYAGFNTSHVTVPSYVKTLSANSFYYTYIKGVTLPEGLETIGASAFELCKLTGTVIIPSTVTSIGSRAFEKSISWESHNAGLNKIINRTGRKFNWKSITNGPSDAYFETGIVENWYGNIEVVKG